MEHVLNLVSHEDDMRLCTCPTLEEAKKVVSAFSGGTASGPDGFSSIFYQA